MRNIITTASIDKAMVDEWGRDPEKYVISMSAKDVKNSYVIVNDSSGKDIRVRRTDIPVDKRIEIIDALRRNGSLVTEKTIADFWVNWVKKK